MNLEELERDFTRDGENILEIESKQTQLPIESPALLQIFEKMVTIRSFENKVKELRLKGMNRYEIVNVLKPKLKGSTPSPSGVYNILRREGLNRLKPQMKQNKRKIIKEKAGESPAFFMFRIGESGGT